MKKIIILSRNNKKIGYITMQKNEEDIKIIDDARIEIYGTLKSIDYITYDTPYQKIIICYHVKNYTQSRIITILGEQISVCQ